ncbi:hypothetical protein GOOTI_118_00010, partial [Gordonia otitidis NBRC 100426]
MDQSERGSPVSGIMQSGDDQRSVHAATPMCGEYGATPHPSDLTVESVAARTSRFAVVAASGTGDEQSGRRVAA